MNGLSVTDLICGYPQRPVIRGVTLPLLQPGSVTALIGPNGAGKSTLLRGLAGLLPVKGQVALHGQDLIHIPAPKRADLLGFMPQGQIGHLNLSVLGCVMSALPRQPDQDRAAYAILSRLGAGDLANRAIGKLSGGQRQVIALAIAIARNPQVILLDEPTSALDLARRHIIMENVRSLTAEGRIAVVVLHDLAFAAQWADQIAVLSAGRLHSFGSPDHVLIPAMLREVWGVLARVERCSAERVQIMIDGALTKEDR